VLLRDSGFHVQREVGFDVVFRERLIGRYRADLAVNAKVIVEVKTARVLDSSHVAQVINYLSASNLRVGMLLNFGAKSEFKRIVN
jgi:GxxExxY protein